MWDLPGPGLEPVSPALADRFLATVPPGKPFSLSLDFSSFGILCLRVVFFLLIVFMIHRLFSESWSFWPWFWMRNQLLILLSIPGTWWVVSLILLLRFFVSGFHQVDYKVPLDFFEFILHGIIEFLGCIDSFFPSNLGGFQPLLFQMSFLLLYYFLSFCDLQCMHMLVCLMVFQRSLSLFFFSLFFSLCFSG